MLWTIANNAIPGFPLSDIEGLTPQGVDGNIDIAEVVTEVVTVDWHYIITAAAGDLVNQHMATLRNSEHFVLAIDGAIPTAANGKYCSIFAIPGNYTGGIWDPYVTYDPVENRTEFTMAGGVLWLASSPHCLAVVADGTCASYGGVPAASASLYGSITNRGNITGAKSAWEWINGGPAFGGNSLNKIILNIPGCPPNSDWQVGSIGAALLELNAILNPGTWGAFAGILLNNLDTSLDHKGRPKLVYKPSVGDNKNVLIELNIEQTRHNEIQLLGNGDWCIALGGRDCSLQMHEQKLLEISVTQEGLALEIDKAKKAGLKKQLKALESDLQVLKRMEEQSERFGRAVGLDSASTFECIVDRDRHYFMEVNTRIHVEHRVTELVYSLKFTNPKNKQDFFVVESLVEAMAILALHKERLPRPERLPRFGVVPVGLTEHRKAGPPLRTLERQDALQAIETIDAFQRRFRRKHGDSIVYGSDELYIKAGVGFPALTEYGELPQIENGVGMVPLFMHQARRIKIPQLKSKRRVVTFTGASFFPYLNTFLERLRRNGADIEAAAVGNTFFGKSVTVAGLLTGRDVAKALSDRIRKEDVLLVPDVVMKEGEEVSLDDVSLQALESILGVQSMLIQSTPKGLIDALSSIS